MQCLDGVLVPSDNSLALKDEVEDVSECSLTVSLLISLDIDCSVNVCFDHVTDGSRLHGFSLTGRPKAGGNPARPPGPEVPWEEVDMSFSITIGCDLHRGRILCKPVSEEPKHGDS